MMTGTYARRVIKADEAPTSLPVWRPAPQGQVPAATPTSRPALAPAYEVPAPDFRPLEEEARQRGLAEGIRAAEESYRSKMARLDQLAASLEAERERFFARMEPELVRLAMSIAEKIIGQELELRPEAVLDIIRGAMKRLRDREELRISVNPRDVERVKEAREDLISAVDGVKRIDIIEDRRVEAGGCVIESPNGTLDARLRTQLDEVGNALQELLPELEDEEVHGPQPVS
jgi:flagellar assembly protein FliH